MKYIVTADEMREYDNNTIERIGIPSMVLMERAALAVRDVVLAECKMPGKVLIVTGSGNNGADGLALARMLAEEAFQVVVCAIGNENRATEQYLQQRNILMHYPVRFWSREELLTASKEQNNAFDMVVDAVFGVGLSRTVSGDYAADIDAMNQMQARKVAVDIPSGICADTGKVLGIAFHADITVTFGFGKLGLYLYPGADYAGQIHVVDIGISEKAFFDKKPQAFIYDEKPQELLPVRQDSGNKGTFGKVLIIAGFEKMVGAAVLSAKAALEMGAGMVKVLCPIENRAILQSAVPEVLYGTCEDLENSIKWADVVVIGPGLGLSAEAQEVLSALLTVAELPLVLDADALNMISASEALKQQLRSYTQEKVLTPHVGELARLCGNDISYVKEHFVEVAQEVASDYHSVTVCKDARTLVSAENKELYVNISGNNGMATAGSGDVLSGIVGALLAQNAGVKDAFTGACTGVYLHGLAGDVARDVYTEFGVTAGRIVENIRNIYL